MEERDANLPSGNESSSSRKNTRSRVDRRQPPAEKRKKLQQKAGASGPGESSSREQQQNLPVSLPLVIHPEANNRNSPSPLMIEPPRMELIIRPQIDDGGRLRSNAQYHNRLREHLVPFTPGADFDRTHFQPQQRRNNQGMIHQQQQQDSYPSTTYLADESKYGQRLKEYMTYLRNGPKTIEYLRKFVACFYDRTAKERWCVSSYKNMNQNILGAFSFPDLVSWSCDLCGDKSGKGFEASFEILPRLLQKRFASGEIDHILYVDSCKTRWIKPGVLMFEYGKVILETLYPQFRLTRHGRLRIVFGQDLKILSWEFCSQHHQELVPRRLIVPRVNQLIHAANEYQRSIYGCAAGNVSFQQLQSSAHSCAVSGQQLTNFLELPVVNDLGFSAKHGRSLEIAKVVYIMKDLMDFSFERQIGPIESLQTYPRAGNNMNAWAATSGNTMNNMWAASGNNMNMRASVQQQPEEQETSEQGGSQNVQTTWVRSMPMSYAAPGEYYNNNARLNSERAFIAGAGGEQRSMPSEYDHYQRLQRVRILSTMESVAKYEQELMNHFEQREAPPPYPAENPGSSSLRNTVLNSLSSLQALEARKIVQEHVMNNTLHTMVAESSSSSSRGKGVALQNAFGRRQEQFLHYLDTQRSGGSQHQHQHPVVSRIMGSTNGIPFRNAANPAIAEGSGAGSSQRNGNSADNSAENRTSSPPTSPSEPNSSNSSKRSTS